MWFVWRFGDAWRRWREAKKGESGSLLDNLVFVLNLVVDVLVVVDSRQVLVGNVGLARPRLWIVGRRGWKIHEWQSRGGALRVRGRRVE